MNIYYVCASDDCSNDFNLFVSAETPEKAVDLWREYYGLIKEDCWNNATILGEQFVGWSTETTEVYHVQPMTKPGVYNWEEMTPVAHVPY